VQGVVDPEAKRKAIGAGFIRVFDDFARRLEQQHSVKPRFLVQVKYLSPLRLSRHCCSFVMALWHICNDFSALPSCVSGEQLSVHLQLLTSK
jgi:hypothetical protein